MRNYAYYKNLLKNERLPLAFIDLDYIDENNSSLLQRSGNKPIRIASKSIRVRAIMDRILASDQRYQGIMCFHPEEAVWLHELGYEDLLLAYPCFQEKQIEAICERDQSNNKITIMVDLPEHLALINRVAKRFNKRQSICLDIDMSTKAPGLHFGVHRSTLNSVEKVKALIPELLKHEHLDLRGIMGYEAQVAGVGNTTPGQFLKNKAISLLQRKAIDTIAQRRQEVVKALKEAGFNVELVNAGGTGSLESSSQESWVTEVTAGSGFFAPGLFDNYAHFQHKPAAAFAIEITRRPQSNIFTCAGGGYTASGSVSADKSVKEYLPEGIQLTPNEGAGEVQTPMLYSGVEKLQLGDPIFLRHSKAGELFERFNTVHLIQSGKIVEQVPTYRGEGKCFL